MRLIPGWQEVSMDTHSVRFLWCLAWAFIILPDIAFAALGFEVVSPYLKGRGALVFVGLILLGRLLDQGIADGRRRQLPAPIERIAWFTLFPLAVFGVLVLISIGGWIVRML